MLPIAYQVDRGFEYDDESKCREFYCLACYHKTRPRWADPVLDKSELGDAECCLCGLDLSLI